MLIRQRVALYLIVLLSFSAFSKEEERRAVEVSVLEDLARKRREFRVSEKYYAGSNLIYDCDDRHFACVNELSYTICQERRNQLKEQKKFQLGCAPLKKFKIAKECHKVHYEKVYQRASKRFCQNTRSFRY